MQKITLIFPMAGQGARFGYRFKPFLEVHGQSFIEAAVAPFRAFLPRIAAIHFVFTREQEESHQVCARLAAMFGDLPWQAAVLPAATRGPAETLAQCLQMRKIAGPVLVCDCDHAVDVSGLMQIAAEPSEAECAVPTWDLKGEALHSWSVAAVTQGGRIVAVKEKALPDRGDHFRGVIGCYYFADGARASRFIDDGDIIYLSDLMARYIRAGRPVMSVPVLKAHFFGDPARLAAAAGTAVA